MRRTFEQLRSCNGDKHCIQAFIEAHHPHLLQAYDGGSLATAIDDVRPPPERIRAALRMLCTSRRGRVRERKGLILGAARSVVAGTTTERRNDGAGPLSREPSGALSLRAICFVAALAKASAFAAACASHLIPQRHRRAREDLCRAS